MDGTHKKSGDKTKTKLHDTAHTLVHDSREVPREIIEKNKKSLFAEMDWLHTIILARMDGHSGERVNQDAIAVLAIAPLPELPDGSYADFVRDNKLGYMERLVVMLAFVADFEPETLELIFNEDMGQGKRRHVVGGRTHPTTKQFIPTLRTALFLLTGGKRDLTITYKPRLTQDNIIFKEQIVNLVSEDGALAGYSDPALVIDPEYSNYFMTSKVPRLDHGEDFPARLLETNKNLNDLVLNEAAREATHPPAPSLGILKRGCVDGIVWATISSL